jgi:hypothetical protein
LGLGRKRLLGPEQKHFFTCFRRANVPPTNNQAERSLRPVVIMRKVVQGTRSDKGLENHSVLRSLFETARRQGKKPHRFFLDLLTKTTVRAQAALYRTDLQLNSEFTLNASSLTERLFTFCALLRVAETGVSGAFTIALVWPPFLRFSGQMAKWSYPLTLGARR